MEDWKEELLDKAQQIKTETQEGANTNVRVGGLFEEVINRLGEGSLKEPISSMNGNVAGTMMANTVVARNDRNTGWEYKVLNSGSTESSILADLTNEMDAVALDRNLKAEYSTQVWTTIVLHYGGSTPQITNIVATCSVPTVIIYPEQNSSGYTGRVRVTVPQGTDFSSGSVITSITATCSEGSGTADFTIMGVKQGTDGQSAVVYQLMPSVSAIKRDSSNVYTTTSISCSIQKRLGTGGVSAVDPVLPDPSEPGRETLYIRYSIDGSPYADYTGTIRFDSLNNPPVSTIGFILLQYNAEQSREIVIDKETVPVVLDGIDGATPFVVDIDNEMSAIPVNENGHVVTDKQITLNISGFFGSMSVTSDCEANVATEAIAYLSGYNITVTQGRTAMQLIVQIAASESVVMPGVIDIPIDVHSDFYGDRKLTFTLCTVKSGGQGEDAEIYQLKPNYSSIPFYRTSGGVLIGEYNFECQIQKTVGSTTIVYEPDALTGYAVYYQFSKYGSSPSEEALLEDPITINTTTVARYNRLELELWKLDNLGVKSLRLDRETIPLLSDGQRGDDGESPIYYDIDTEGIMTITRHLDGNYTPSTIQAQAIEHIGNEQNNAIDKYEDMVLYAFYGTTEKPQDSSAYEYIDHNTLTNPKTLTAHVQEKIGQSHGFVYFQFVKKQDNTEIVITSKRVAVIDEIAGPEGESVYVADLDNPMDSVSCNESGGVVSAQTVSTTISLYYGSQESSFNISSLARNGNAITIGTTTNGVTPTYSNHVLSIRYESGTNGATISNGKDVYTITITKELEDSTITRTLYFTVNGIVGVTYNLLLPVKEIKAVVNENNQYVVDGETTYALRCGYTKNNNGTITSVNDASSIIDNNYCIYFRRHTRGGSWDSSYTAYYQDPNLVRNFNVNTYDAIVFYLCKNKGGSVQTLADVLDYEDIYVVADGKEGKEGKSAIHVDLDNEHEDFIYNDAGERISNQVVTQARLYDGITQITDTTAVIWNITDVDGDSSWGTNTSTNVTASIATSGLITINGIWQNTAKLRVRASYKSNYYYAAFTTNRIKWDKYDLILVPDVISYNPNSPLESSISISAKRMDMQGSIVNINFGSYYSRSDISTTPNYGYLRLYYCYMSGGSKGTFSQVTQSPFTINTSDANDYTGVYFELRKYETYSASTYSIVDYETVPIVKDGGNGQKGEDGYSVIINPEYAIFDEVVSGQTTSVNTSNWVGRIQLFKGSLTQSARIHVLTCSNCSFSQRNSDTPIMNNYSYYSDDIVFGFSISTSGGVFPSEGYLLCEVESQEQVNNSPVFIKENIKIPFYINKLGTFDRKIENGIETATGNAKEYTDSQNVVLKSDYETKITTSAKGLTQQFTEQISRAGATGANLFGFHKDVKFDYMVPFIQGYGLVCDYHWNTADKTGRIWNLGMHGRLGYYTVKCLVQTSNSAGYVRLQMNWHNAVAGTQVSAGIKGVVYATTSEWRELTATFLFNDKNEAHIGTTVPEGQSGSYASGDINGYIDVGQISDSDDGTRISVPDNRIYVRHLKVEYKDIATDFCEADEDVAYLGHGNVAKNLDFRQYRPEDAENQTVDGRSGVYRIRMPYLTNTNPWSDTTDSFRDYLVENSFFNLEAGKCYTLSFWAKASVNGFIITQHLYKDNYNIINSIGNDIYVDPSNGTIQESIMRDGQTQVKLSTTWTQYFVHFYVANNVPLANVVPLRIFKSYNDSSERDLAYIYMSDIELQEGYVTSTDYFASFINQNARRISLVQQSGTKLAGIDIQNGTVNLMGDRVIFSNSTGTVSGKVWIDPDDATIYAVDGNFSGEVTATSGTIGGFTIDTNRLYNSNWNAGIDINTNDGKNVKIGKNAQGESFTEDAIIRAENTKTKSKTSNTYNTALYLNASNARYNYAFYGNGNGVLNGLVFGYKTTFITLGSGDVQEPIDLMNGASIFIKTPYLTGNKSVKLPKLEEVRKCLGISNNSTDFAIELNFVNISNHSNIYIEFSKNISENNKGFPKRMSDASTQYTEDDAKWQIQSNQYCKVLLVCTSGNDFRGYVK